MSKGRDDDPVAPVIAVGRGDVKTTTLRARAAISTTRAVERCTQLAILGPPPPWYRPILLLRWLRLYRAIMALDISVHAEMLRSLYTPEAAQATADRQAPTFAALRMVPRSERE